LFDPFFLQDVATVRSLNQPDGLHPDVEGVKHIVARLLPLVEKLLAEVPPA
jgi:acyl-CoA thioesterase-1